MSLTTPHRRRASVGLIVAGALLAITALVAPSIAGAGVAPNPESLAGETVTVNNTPYPYNNEDCDEQGWHIVMNQVEPRDVVDAGDFGSVTLVFTDGTTGTATFAGITPGGVVSWYYQPAPGTAPQTVASASMTFPADSRVTEFGQFVISAPACYEEIPPVPPTPPTPPAPPTEEEAPPRVITARPSFTG